MSGRRICASAELAEGEGGVRFMVRHDGEEAAAFAIRHQGRVLGWLNRCAHLPVELDWQPGQFYDTSGLYLICATHGAMYDPATGACVGGRCNGRGLIAVGVREEDGWVMLDEEGGNGG